MTRITTGAVWFFLAFLGVVSSFTPPINSVARPQPARRTVAVSVVEEKTKPAETGYLDSLSAESSAPAEAEEEEEELTETQKLLKKVKEA